MLGSAFPVHLPQTQPEEAGLGAKPCAKLMGTPKSAGPTTGSGQGSCHQSELPGSARVSCCLHFMCAFSGTLCSQTLSPLIPWGSYVQQLAEPSDCREVQQLSEQSGGSDSLPAWMPFSKLCLLGKSSICSPREQMIIQDPGPTSQKNVS